MTQLSPGGLLANHAKKAGIEQLETALQKQLRGTVWEFSLSLFDDGLVLRGHTSSYYGKQLAQHAVMKVTSIPIQANEICVTYH